MSRFQPTAEICFLYVPVSGESPEMDSSWSLAVVAPNRDVVASRVLTYLGFKHHSFKLRRQVVRRGAIVERILPAFPGYIFVSAYQRCWDIARDIVSVVGFVHFGEGLSLVPHHVVEGLVSLADADGVLPTPPVKVSSRFAPGDRVVIQGDGVLAGHQGIYQRVLIGPHVIIDVDWMGRWVPISVDERDLETASVSKLRKRRRRQRHKSHRARPINLVEPPRVSA